VLGHGSHVLGIFAAMQNPAMDLGMQSLNPAVQHFRKSGELGNVFHGHLGIAQQLGRSAGRDKFDADSRKFAGEINQSGFVGDAEDGAVNFGHEAWLLGDQKKILAGSQARLLRGIANSKPRRIRNGE